MIHLPVDGQSRAAMRAAICSSGSWSVIVDERFDTRRQADRELAGRRHGVVSTLKIDVLGV